MTSIEIAAQRQMDNGALQPLELSSIQAPVLTAFTPGWFVIGLTQGFAFYLAKNGYTDTASEMAHCVDSDALLGRDDLLEQRRTSLK